MSAPTPAQQLAATLTEALWQAADNGDIDLDGVNTFADLGLVTRAAGLVVETSDGRTFHLTINDQGRRPGARN